MLACIAIGASLLFIVSAPFAVVILVERHHRDQSCLD